MKRVLASLLVILPVLAETKLPPLPVNPNIVPRSILQTTQAPLVLAWSVGSACRDVLEMSASPAFEVIHDLPGPYRVVQELDGDWGYRVSVPVGYAAAFFRVRRAWGNPWIAQ